MSDGPEMHSAGAAPPHGEVGAAAPVPTARPVTARYAAAQARELSAPSWLAPILRLAPREAMLDFFLILFVGLIAHYLPQILVASILKSPTEFPDSPLIAIASKYGELLLALTLLIYLVQRHRLAASAFGWTREEPLLQGVWAVAALAGAYAALLATAPLMIAIYLLSPGMEQDLEQRLEFAKALGSRNAFLDVALMAAVGFHEEILFRGLMLPYLRRITGSWTAAIVAVSAIFGVLHVPTQGVLAGIQITLLGVSFGIFFMLSRSVVSVALAHMAFNLLQLQVMQFVIQFWEKATSQPISA